MKNAISLLLLLVCSVAAHAQFKDNIAAQRKYLNMANVLNYEKKTDSALAYYELAWLQIADVYIANGDYPRAANAYTQAMLRGAVTDACADLVLNYDKYKTQPEIMAFATAYDSVKRVFYGQRFNLKFDRLITELEAKDQYARNLLVTYRREDSLMAGMQWAAVAKLDTAENLKALLNYLDEYGFPALSTLDNTTQHKMWQVVHHILQYKNNTEVHRLEHMVQEAVYSGNYIVQDYLATLDHRYVQEKKKQLYGTYKQRNGLNITFSPGIDDVAGIDARRDKWLLLSLKMASMVEEAPGTVTIFPDDYAGK